LLTVRKETTTIVWPCKKEQINKDTNKSIRIKIYGKQT
jgi:hypothetical protein